MLQSQSLPVVFVKPLLDPCHQVTKRRRISIEEVTHHFDRLYVDSSTVSLGCNQAHGGYALRAASSSNVSSSLAENCSANRNASSTGRPQPMAGPPQRPSSGLLSMQVRQPIPAPDPLIGRCGEGSTSMSCTDTHGNVPFPKGMRATPIPPPTRRNERIDQGMQLE
eukprot:gnl/MRDRNA2_/MRDRNA2_162486_c0_seq1.p1 gnl/MRDRNA2_/MRDRNA2_162486_c0~~gnl/MRDRNA2_/MRDRNA2_162486_c0_seq1.p1  ORF type:complete len:166 (+),score=16.34 gnl/MRDRNA2_/MRDRNA2_162486_c0_seq1:133-630(+)